MESKPSAFRRQVLRHLPPGAHYYYLVRCNPRGGQTRLPGRGAFRATPAFQDPSASPGTYFVLYCADAEAKQPVKIPRKPHLLTKLAAEDTAHEREAAEFIRFRAAVHQEAPEDATHYHLAKLDGAKGPDGSLALGNQFEFPTQATSGWWQVRYTRDRDQPCDEPLLPVIVELQEPVAKGEEVAQPPAHSGSRSDLLSLLDRHYELNRELRSTLRTLADQWSRIEGHYQRAASAPDYTAVLKYLADSIREAVRLPTGSVPVAQQVQANDCVGKPAAGSASAAAIAAVEAATLQAIADVRKSAARPKRSSPEKLEAEVDAQIAEALIMRDPDFRLNRAHLIELERKPT